MGCLPPFARCRHPESKLSRLNGWPVRPPVNASPRPSRAPAHDSGPMWIATPSSQGICTLYSLPVSRRFAHVFRFAPESGPPICALMITCPHYEGERVIHKHGRGRLTYRRPHRGGFSGGEDHFADAANTAFGKE